MKNNCADKNSDKSLFKRLLTVKGRFSESVKLLAAEGYSDGYMIKLEEERFACTRKKDIVQGDALIAQAKLFRGELNGALELFEQIDISLLPKEMRCVYSSNYLMCVFILGKTNRVKELYVSLNEWLLSENIPQMRRSVGINEYAEKRYENAVTVFVKLISVPDPRATLFNDYCLVKAMVALDMYDEAVKIAQESFSRYKGRGEFYTKVKELQSRAESRADAARSGNGHCKNQHRSGKKRR